MKSRSLLILLVSLTLTVLTWFWMDVVGRSNIAYGSGGLDEMIGNHKLVPSEAAEVDLEEVSVCRYDDQSIEVRLRTEVPRRSGLRLALKIDLDNMEYTTSRDRRGRSEADLMPATQLTDCPYKYRVTTREQLEPTMETLVRLTDKVEWQRGPQHPVNPPCLSRVLCWHADGWTEAYPCSNPQWTLYTGDTMLQHLPKMKWVNPSISATTYLELKPTILIANNGKIHVYDQFARRGPSEFILALRHTLSIDPYL